MSVQAVTSACNSRQRRAWSIFWAVAAAALGACFFTTLWSSGVVGAGLVLLGGLIVVGLATAMMHSIVTPFPDQLRGSRGMRSGFGDFGGFDSGAGGRGDRGGG